MSSKCALFSGLVPTLSCNRCAAALIVNHDCDLQLRPNPPNFPILRLGRIRSTAWWRLTPHKSSDSVQSRRAMVITVTRTDESGNRSYNQDEVWVVLVAVHPWNQLRGRSSQQKTKGHNATCDMQERPSEASEQRGEVKANWLHVR